MHNYKKEKQNKDCIGEEDQGQEGHKNTCYVLTILKIFVFIFVSNKVYLFLDCLCFGWCVGGEIISGKAMATMTGDKLANVESALDKTLQRKLNKAVKGTVLEVWHVLFFLMHIGIYKIGWV